MQLDDWVVVLAYQMLLIHARSVTRIGLEVGEAGPAGPGLTDGGAACQCVSMLARILSIRSCAVLASSSRNIAATRLP